jgi:hypothetical protein
MSATKMPGTLREFSQWVDWIVKGKQTVHPLTGDEYPSGELYDALTAEVEAKAAVAVYDADKDRALGWLAAWHDQNLDTDPAVTTEYRFTYLPGRTVPAGRKINSERLKTRYPVLWAQSRTLMPYRTVKFPEHMITTPPTLGRYELEPAPSGPVDELAVSWGTAFRTYRTRLEQVRDLRKVVDDAVGTMARLLTDLNVRVALGKFWDGHGEAQFTDGTRIGLDRLQFSQEKAAEVLDSQPLPLKLDGIVTQTQEYQTAASRRIVKIDYESAGEAEDQADPNPFEGN